MFKNEDGTVNESSAILAFLTVGREAGLVRDKFDPLSFIANYPELIKEDIYVNDQISSFKLAKIWIERFKDGIKLDKFDPEEFCTSLGLDCDAGEATRKFVEDKIQIYKKLLKKRSSIFYRLTSCCRCSKCCKADDDFLFV